MSRIPLLLGLVLVLVLGSIGCGDSKGRYEEPVDVKPLSEMPTEGKNVAKSPELPPPPK